MKLFNALTRNLARNAAAAFLLLLCAHAASATTRWVNTSASQYAPPGVDCKMSGYPTIQAAVNASVPGDTVRVCPGVYPENVVIGVPLLTVTSTGGPMTTRVQAATNAYVFAIRARLVTVRGLTIVVAPGSIGVNVAVQGPAVARILGNVILRGAIGVNLGCSSSQSLVAGNRVNSQTEAGINIDTCESAPFPGTHNNSIHHNSACSNAATASIALGTSSNDNVINDNVATTISVYGDGNAVNDNTTQVPIIDNGTNSLLNNNTASPAACT